VIDTGQVYHATLTLRGQSIAPSTATLVITLPDGTVVPGTTPGAGTAAGPDWVISYDYATTVPGLHKVSWQTTGPGTAAVDYFNVRAFASILSLAEAKLHLSAGPGSTWTSDDDELRNFLQAVTEVVEAKVGPCVRRTTVQRVAGYSAAAIVLNQAPVITVTSVTSVWSGGPAWTTPQLIVDGDAGIVSVQFGAPPFLVRAVGRRLRVRPRGGPRTIPARRERTAQAPVGQPAGAAGRGAAGRGDFYYFHWLGVQHPESCTRIVAR